MDNQLKAMSQKPLGDEDSLLASINDDTFDMTQYKTNCVPTGIPWLMQLETKLKDQIEFKNDCQFVQKQKTSFESRQRMKVSFHSSQKPHPFDQFRKVKTSGLQILPNEKITDPDQAKNLYLLIVTKLIETQLISQRMNYKNRRFNEDKFFLKDSQLTNELLCVNTPMHKKAIARVRDHFKDKASFIYFRDEPLILFHGS